MLLREVLGTKYLTDEYADDVSFLISQTVRGIKGGEEYTKEIYAYRVRDFINEAVKSGSAVIDLSDCRFTQKVWRALTTIREHRNIITLVDSGDERRNEFIQSYIGYEYPYKDYKHIRGLPGKPTDILSMNKWMERLENNVVYELYDKEYTDNPWFILSLNLFNPELKIIADIDSVVTYAKNVFGDYLLNKCNKFYYVYGPQKVLLTADVENGQVYIPNIGWYDKRTFVLKYNCMPWFIGNQRISVGVTDPDLREIYTSILKATDSYLKDKPITIESYFN